MPETSEDLALVLGTSTDTAPGTHVLVIGMETYPYLEGGQSHVAGQFEGMRQLMSASRSARAVAKWFLGCFENCDQPLSSMALVLSEPGPASFSHERLPAARSNLPRGTVAETAAAIKAWARRAAAHPDNLAILYFCGHGVSYGGSQLLLCNDFAECPDAAYQASVNLANLTAALGTRRPKQQLILADCCREPLDIAQSVIGRINLGISVMDPSFGAEKCSTRLSAHTSTSDMSTAFGRRSGLTFFAEALIVALNGGGVQYGMDEWVGTIGLQEALAAYVIRAAEQADVEQEPDLIRYARFKLHKPTVVKIPLHVMCEPQAAIRDDGTFEAHSGGVLVEAFRPTAAIEQTWSPVLPPGEYDVSAVFGVEAPWISATRRVRLYPPGTSCELRPSRRPPWAR